ncbi:phosphopyruvate hydratase [Candidatus Babeliales bacterium]|nr:phosphopyruvate hydratase [Candidatus Babeliales bacterium]
MKIKKINAREILDSRGWPTIACSVELENGIVGEASVPSGASVGKHEAVELRDGDASHYFGRGVLCAIKNITDVIAPVLCGKPADVIACDKIMCELDGTPNKSKLGANAILAVSMGVARAQAQAENKPLHLFLQELCGQVKSKISKAMFNIINGGIHAQNNLSFQEFMIVPAVGDSFADQLQAAVLIYHELKNILVSEKLATGVGDEGGFAPSLPDGEKPQEELVLDLLLRATEQAGFKPGEDVFFALDVAASEFYDEKEEKYSLADKKLSANELIDLYKNLCKKYPIYSIEDGLAQDDWAGWALMTKELGANVQLVGDDIFVSNVLRIQRGIEEVAANAVLIKPNQIGTVSETIEAIKLCKKNNINIIVSHRSGETNDSFISDLSVGACANGLKAGAPVRGERVAKYNRLLAIEKTVV